MFSPKGEMLSLEEKDTLKELMNIAFGSASADLAEVINIYLKLSIPEIDITGVENLADYIIKTVDLNSLSTLVEQKFWGSLKGQGVLIFPRAEKEDILSVLHSSVDPVSSEEFPFQPGLEQGAFLEVGNILLGACVGKIAELMETYVTYSPPQVLYGCQNNLDFLSASLSKDCVAIILKTSFEFYKKSVQGFLIIITDQTSVGFLKEGVKSFLEAYE